MVSEADGGDELPVAVGAGGDRLLEEPEPVEEQAVAASAETPFFWDVTNQTPRTSRSTAVVTGG